jgi:enamine deaminase RidA (YjgF/YER057c/UK114 family)
MQHYVRPDGLPPVSGYSHAVAFTGRMVAVSGQVPADRDGRLVGPGDPAAQVRQVFENLTMALGAALRHDPQRPWAARRSIPVSDEPAARSRTSSPGSV